MRALHPSHDRSRQLRRRHGPDQNIQIRRSVALMFRKLKPGPHFPPSIQHIGRLTIPSI